VVAPEESRLPCRLHPRAELAHDEAARGLQSAIDAKRPGDTVSITYTRDGTSTTVQVSLGTRPS
jgi:hypothetical protein